MGEGAVLLMLKRLADAERDGDNIYAVLRGIAGASDGKGKGITAPNPIGQKLSIERAWQNAGLSPATATLIEGHGTSTPVGDVVEAQSLNEVLSSYQLPRGSVALGSVKSNIGHLKSAAGAVGLLKTALALRDKVLPPSVHCEHPNPDIDFDHSPLRVNTELKPWTVPADSVRRAGVSAFGFGGTNFHAVLEEYIPHRLNGNGKRSIAVSVTPPAVGHKAPLRGTLVIGAPSDSALSERLRSVQKAAESGRAPAPSAPAESDLRAPERLAIDYSDAADLADKSAKALKALAANQPAVWKALRAQGIFRGHGPAPKVAFLYTGQGSQYVNMLKPLRALEPIVAQTFAEADRVMTPLIGKPLSDFIFVDQADASAVAKAEEDLRQTAITQPAVLAADMALTRLLAAYGIQPDMTMGHSLGEYGALIASGGLPFADALEAVSARGREMTRVSVEDNGKMAAVFAPIDEIERILKTIDGYVVIANINSDHQAVIGGATKTVEHAMEVLQKAGYEVVPLPVSHAFHTSIVAPASDPLRQVLQRLRLQSPSVPIVANVNGEFYPTGPDAAPQMVDILGRQIASPVQFVKGLRKLYDAGARVFVEVGPKKALQGFVDDVLGGREDVVALFTNHPKVGDVAAFNQALCGLYAAGLGAGQASVLNPKVFEEFAKWGGPPGPRPTPPSEPDQGVRRGRGRPPHSEPAEDDRYTALGHLFADVLDRASQIYHGQNGVFSSRPVTITGAALGLPGTEHIFDDSNVSRILRGEQFIDVIPARFRRAILDKHITRLVKSDNGGPTFETIDAVGDVIKLAGRAGAFDLEKEFGVSADRMPALDRVTQLAIAAGLDALRDAGIPLVMRYKTTSKGTQLPDRWGLPDSLRDDTGVIFASAFPGYDSFAEEASRYYQDRARREQLVMLENLRARLTETNGHSAIAQEIDNRIDELRTNGKEPYVLDRRFLFKILAMGHSQFAEFIGARGPNAHVNAACASTTQAIAVAEDWIRAGRCRRVIVVAADDVTSDHLMEWMGAGFLASGAAATDEVVEEAALPFDRRRHGMIIGMGAAALVVEDADAAHERGIRPICEVLSAVTANSAFHGTRLDLQHICQVMEKLVAEAEARSGIPRRELARQMVFVSHETYTPARGGSAAAEINALRHVFGEDADRIVIANTKGFTGHAMGAGIEDVVAVKALETGCVPPVANFKEADPELGVLNLSKGAVYPIEYALRLGAGFGSQISMTLLRRVATKDGLRPSPNALGYSYRIADPTAWNAWLSQLAGDRAADLEVVHRTLRVRDAVAPARVAEVAQDLEPATASGDPVKERILALVVEKTGYPLDMLALDLDLEADLGIDTVKQAEMFAAIREMYNIPRDENLKLRDFPTLAHVIRFASGNVGQVANLRADCQSAQDGAGNQPARRIPSCPTSERINNDSIEEKVLAIVTEKTGYPKDMLDLDLDLEADLGIDTVKQAEMFAAIREIYNIPRDENLKLRDFPTLAHVIRFASGKRPDVAAPTVAARTPAPADNSIEEKVLAIVTEKTGYPKDMLDLDLDLEADLGIDTVKQAEMFAAIREIYNIPRDENLKLRDFPTLAHVIRFAQDRRTGSAVEPKQSAPPAQPILASLEATNSIPRRVPVPVLRPPLSMCKPTGVTFGPGSRVIVMADKGGVAAALTDRLRAQGVEVLRIDDTPQADVLNAGPVQGIYWLPALDNEGNLSDMDLATWREAVRVRVKSLYATMRTLYEQIYQPGTFLVSATMLGGQHGYNDAGAVAPLGGAVSGFLKTYKRERLDALVKAVDFPPDCAAPEIAEILIQETQLDPGALEIGYKGGLRFAVGLEEQPAANGQPGLDLNKDTVFLITGAAGSIVSAITADLAAASGGTFYLLDLAPEPKPDDPDLERFMSDKDGLKRDLFARMQASGERATPARIEKELAALERAQAARNAIDAVRAAGGTACYFSVNLTDADAVGQVIREVRERSGRIDVLLHAAGMERSHLLRDKDEREFDLVFDVKSDGWFNLLHAIGDMPLGVTVAFSSVAARFGNAGQADYSSANDLLCKITSSFRTTRPATRGIVVDWTAWAGIGMASRGSIPKMMELAGIDMLPPEAGIPLIRRELTAGDTRGEIVIGQRLGILMNEWDATGGLDTMAAEAQGPMIGKLAGMGLHSGLSIETTLDPAVQPFLHDHQIDGTPVLPGVMAVEAFAEAALSILPGWYVESVEDVNFQSPLKFYRHEPRAVTTEVVFHPQGDTVVADCRLTGCRTLPNRAEPQITTHFTGRVRLTKRRPMALTAPAPGLPAGSTKEAADIYRVYFHGPSYRVIERAWADENRMVGQMATNLPADIEPRQPILMAPRLIELCFQTVGLWELDVRGRAGLPERIHQVSVWRAPELAEGPLYAVVTPDHESFDADVVDTAGNVYVHLSGYRTVALFNGVNAEPAKELHAVEV
jgi:acyl transferase domain-containing protein/NAD(P)-dependent dehydrogenase (short-subunit alcohol dehydrogenase family)